MFPIRDHNPSSRVPIVTYAIMLANILVFVSTWHLAASPRELVQFYADYALVPQFLSNGHGFTGLVTSMFVHGGLAHLAGNMLFLFIFGDNLEDEMGHVGFALFYLAAGIGAGLVHYLSAPGSLVPTVGASGAIAGVMGGYLLLFPKARVDILIILIIIFKVVPVPAWLMLALWFGMQIIGGWGASPDEGGVAYWAHAGGFVVGAILAVPTWLRLGGPRYWSRHHGLPPHPPAEFQSVTRIPRIPRR
ncbi:rhomboid family intramembrane serine protease [Tropicibacter naphthalenivorans]|uniref:Rhomboid protease GluP n=1 Tax=Tropicibacter naphthalenivorans TaxID=441103 RepID=A0A0P1GB31_9RHOB|nr:rhomboid family intramembrane serine protease [Tropicibacter naphthalenivorans]CUH78552.1 Rhomboid protease GluP [Tropicibacter naphthalenivorans]SMC80908.1 Membrane associated serine protease, rhomboid family [Tropicibacter naphthalenivorans]